LAARRSVGVGAVAVTVVVVSALCEHDEAKSEVLFLGLKTRSFGAFSLRPRLAELKLKLLLLLLVGTEGSGGCCWRIQSLQSH